MTDETRSLHTDLPCGINFIITNDKNEILLLKRKSNLGNGTWGLCGGHLKDNETIEETVVRECDEELGIKVNSNDVEVISLADTNREERYLQIGVLVKKYEGIPKIMEPHKASEMMWASEKSLPDNLFFATKPQIRLYFKNKFYDKKENIYLN
jgi:ADP-ribose pyrophosphatase YjhB (NUDIX family)